MKVAKSLHGVHVKHCKNTVESATVKMPVPDRVVIPMKQHMGRECEPAVKLTDLVKVGTLLGDVEAFISAPIHSSVSGKVVAVDEFIASNGERCKAVTIETDKLQEIDESVRPPVVTTREEFVKAIRASGLVGLGGAGFPTHVKLAPRNLDEVDTLLINAAECEPYITADNRTMMEEGAEVLEGVRQVMKHLSLKQAIIGVEDNKPAAIAKMKELIGSDSTITVKTLKSQYPQGGEKVLIYECTGRTVPEGKLPSDVGCIVLNVSTAAFIAKYLKTGMPLTTKRLTVDGGAVEKPQNVEALIGTSFSQVLDFCGLKEEPKKILMGGPMMGIAVYDTSFPVLKNNNAILAFTAPECVEKPETPCIRCARCVSACPFDLMPAAIEKAYNAGNVESLKALKVTLCMECGCCSYVCPAKRSLVMTNRLAKKLVFENSK